MKTKGIPAIIMLTAGAVSCVAGIVTHMETVAFAKQLLIVLVIFYVLGCVVKVILDKNFAPMQDETDAEVKEASEQAEETEEKQDSEEDKKKEEEKA